MTIAATDGYWSIADAKRTIDAKPIGLPQRPAEATFW
jgi:hypothetical protein